MNRSSGYVTGDNIFLVNLFLLVIFIKDRKVWRVPGHMLIVGLMVISDCIIGLVPLPGYLLVTLCGGWPLTSWSCDLWITIDYISTNVSMVSVTTVAFDRFLATNFVFTHKRWMHRANQIRLCVALWLFTSLRNILVFPVWANVSGYRSREKVGKCGHPIYNNFGMGILQRTVALYIPVVLLVVFYGAVVFRILQSSPHFAGHLHHHHHDQQHFHFSNPPLNWTARGDGSQPGASSGGLSSLHTNCVIRCPSISASESPATPRHCAANTGPLISPIITRKEYETAVRVVYTKNSRASRSRGGLLVQANNNNGGSINSTIVPNFRTNSPVVRREPGTPVVGCSANPAINSRSTTLANRISKSFRIVTCVILSFLLANLPWHIIENMIVTKKTVIKKTDALYILFWIMNYMNAFINPIFYMFMHIEYKRTIIRWLCCRQATEERSVVNRRGESSEEPTLGVRNRSRCPLAAEMAAMKTTTDSQRDLELELLHKGPNQDI